MQIEQNTRQQTTARQRQQPEIRWFRRAHGIAAARRGLAGLLAVSMLGLSTGAVWAQQAPPPPDDYDASGPPPQAYQALGPQQLDDLVAPIALYPDSLVAQILAAATYPQQVVSANGFVQENGNVPPSELAGMANEQPWDPSVKSLVAFPQVLADLNQNISWTTSLGNAYYNQPQDVMGAVQAMRQRAYAAGTLRSGPQLSVAYDPGDIIIAPVSPNIVYVPYYNPWVVYGAPLPVYGGYYWGAPRGVVFGAGLAIGFGFGFAIGAFGHFGWGFHSWAPNWQSRTVVYNRTTFISRSTTVINHGYYGRFDRNPQAVAFNRGQAAAYGNHGFNNGPGFHPQPGASYNHGANNPTAFRGGQTYNQGTGYNRGSQTYNQGNNYNHSANNARPGYQQRYQGGAYNARNAPATHQQPQQQHAYTSHPAPQNHGSNHDSGNHDHR